MQTNLRSFSVDPDADPTRLASESEPPPDAEWIIQGPAGGILSGPIDDEDEARELYEQYREEGATDVGLVRRTPKEDGDDE